MESLRLYPPIGAFTKQAPKGLKLSNYEVPEGTAVTVRTCNCSHNRIACDVSWKLNECTTMPFVLV